MLLSLSNINRETARSCLLYKQCNSEDKELNPDLFRFFHKPAWNASLVSEHVNILSDTVHHELDLHKQKEERWYSSCFMRMASILLSVGWRHNIHIISSLFQDLLFCSISKGYLTNYVSVLSHFVQYHFSVREVLKHWGICGPVFLFNRWKGRA